MLRARACLGWHCAGNSRSAEMRYESAWRMGQWQSCEELHSAVPGRPVGTNEAVLGCLKVGPLLLLNANPVASHRHLLMFALLANQALCRLRRRVALSLSLQAFTVKVLTFICEQIVVCLSPVFPSLVLCSSIVMPRLPVVCRSIKASISVLYWSSIVCLL